MGDDKLGNEPSLSLSRYQTNDCNQQQSHTKKKEKDLQHSVKEQKQNISLPGTWILHSKPVIVRDTNEHDVKVLRVGIAIKGG